MKLAVIEVIAENRKFEDKGKINMDLYRALPSQWISVLPAHPAFIR